MSYPVASHRRVHDCPFRPQALANRPPSFQTDDLLGIDDQAMCRESAPTVDPYAYCLQLLDDYQP